MIRAVVAMAGEGEVDAAVGKHDTGPIHLALGVKINAARPAPASGNLPIDGGLAGNRAITGAVYIGVGAAAGAGDAIGVRATIIDRIADGSAGHDRPILNVDLVQ